LKNFWIALILLLLALALTIGNSFFVQAEMRTLYDLAQADDAQATADRFERIEPYLALTVNHVILEQAQNAVSEMTVYATSDDTEYLASRERFLAALREIEEGEKFNVSNIF